MRMITRRRTRKMTKRSDMDKLIEKIATKLAEIEPFKGKVR